VRADMMIDARAALLNFSACMSVLTCRIEPGTLRKRRNK
jgi:hypothetical protein